MTMSILQDDNNNETKKKHTTYHENLQLHNITYGTNDAIFTYTRRFISLFK